MHLFNCRLGTVHKVHTHTRGERRSEGSCMLCIRGGRDSKPSYVHPCEIGTCAIKRRSFVSYSMAIDWSHLDHKKLLGVNKMALTTTECALCYSIRSVVSKAKMRFTCASVILGSEVMSLSTPSNFISWRQISFSTRRRPTLYEGGVEWLAYGVGWKMWNFCMRILWIAPYGKVLKCITKQ